MSVNKTKTNRDEAILEVITEILSDIKDEENFEIRVSVEGNKGARIECQRFPKKTSGISEDKENCEKACECESNKNVKTKDEVIDEIISCLESIVKG